jgi:hypothetical protein
LPRCYRETSKPVKHTAGVTPKREWDVIATDFEHPATKLGH